MWGVESDGWWSFGGLLLVLLLLRRFRRVLALFTRAFRRG